MFIAVVTGHFEMSKNVKTGKILIKLQACLLMMLLCRAWLLVVLTSTRKDNLKPNNNEVCDYDIICPFTFL